MCICNRKSNTHTLRERERVRERENITYMYVCMCICTNLQKWRQNLINQHLDFRITSEYMFGSVMVLNNDDQNRRLFCRPVDATQHTNTTLRQHNISMGTSI